MNAFIANQITDSKCI